MKIGTRLVFWYSGILAIGLLFVSGWAYYEIVVEHPAVARALITEGHTPLEELTEILLFGGLPAMVLAVVSGWFLIRRALRPLSTLTRAFERIHLDTLGEKLPSTHTGDELDRMTTVFNAMTARLNDSFAQIREFTIHASHELKTPLTILRAEMETALRDPATPAGQREIYADQIDEIGRLTKIVDSLTLLAKADAGQLALRREPVRLDELVRESCDDAQTLAVPVRLHVELGRCDEATVQGDRHRLRQLLLNLTENAIKYNQPEGRVGIGLSRANGTAELTITNTGPGIPAEKLPRIFERFYRGDPAHNSAVEGCGLGLSIAQSIVKAHGGTIQVTSEPQRLTTVTVALPVG